MGRIQILLVDDDQDYVETLSERMTNDGLDNQIALSGEEGLRALEQNPPDVMVLDLRMPGMGGMELLERARKDHPETEVIILTGHGGKTVEQEALDGGAFEFLQKPVDYTGLKAVIGRAWQLTKKVSKAVADDILLSFSSEALAPKDAGTGDPSQPALREIPKDGLRVLLVDDEEDFVRSLGERLELRDVGSDVAFSGEEALSFLRTAPPDVMVLDLKMPGMGGMAVLKQVKEEFPQVQVIIQTGQGSEEDEAEARRLGAFDYLKKPVEVRDLMKRVHLAGQQAAQAGHKGGLK